MGPSKPANPEDALPAIEKIVPDLDLQNGEHDVHRPAKEFNRDDFMAKMFHDVDLAREVAGLFLSYTPEIMTAIREALLRKDASAVAITAQSLKGSVANIGAEQALGIATELEHLGHAGNLVDAEKTFRRLESVVENLRKNLASISRDAQPWRMLIADDDPVSRRMLQATLMKWGHDPIVTSDGTSALRILLGPDAPRMAILDWMMPGLYGVEICRELRKRVKSDYIYVILLTGKDKTDDIIEGLDAGADDYMVKPFDPYELKARVREGFRMLDRLKGPISDVSESPGALTDFLGREGILVLLKREIAKLVNNPIPVSAIMVRLDGFDLIRDDFGQNAVNSALREIAWLARSAARDGDFIGRYSEDKLLLVLPGCDRGQAETLGKKLRSSLESCVVQSNDVTVPVTACLGVTSVLPSARVNVEHIISATESALKQAHTKGPNQYGFALVESEAAEVVQEKKKPISKLELELIIASRSGDLPRVKRLISSGAQVNACDNKGNTALMEAAFFKYPEVVRLLLEKGADVTIHNNGGETALTEAIRAGQTEVVELLLPKFTASDIKEDSALLYKALLEASSYGKTQVVKLVKSYLLAHGYIRATKK
ncbi:MAG: response regulator [Desulfomonile tiedjei]|uniref:Response regulator n=1 Tax=Desulfomonile tiedjei TaxID=2358 RepID=A0A9D6Z468_9BACT|nr:response regulator [Desulfomonile tiedjei]